MLNIGANPPNYCFVCV